VNKLLAAVMIVGALLAGFVAGRETELVRIDSKLEAWSKENVCVDPPLPGTYKKFAGDEIMRSL
jgi:hypothetical protein